VRALVSHEVLAEDVNRRTPEVVAMVKANADLAPEEFEVDAPHLTVKARINRPGLITGGSAKHGNPEDYTTASSTQPTPTPGHRSASTATATNGHGNPPPPSSSSHKPTAPEPWPIPSADRSISTLTSNTRIRTSTTIPNCAATSSARPT
jgi:hypothetical protein